MNYLVFDTETTGVDVFNDRVVQLYVMLMTPTGAVISDWEWIINPGVPIPTAVSDVHGFTDEFVAAEGIEPAAAFWEALEVFQNNADAVWVAYNLNFDLTILDAEFRRHGLTSDFGEQAAKGNLLDPLVTDRAKDKYRKGKRTLEAIAPVYNVDFDASQAHKADYDVFITGQVALKVVERYGLAFVTEQARWYAEWARGLQEYLRRSDASATVDPNWPLRKEQ